MKFNPQWREREWKLKRIVWIIADSLTRKIGEPRYLLQQSHSICARRRTTRGTHSNSLHSVRQHKPQASKVFAICILIASKSREKSERTVRCLAAAAKAKRRNETLVPFFSKRRTEIFLHVIEAFPSRAISTLHGKMHCATTKSQWKRSESTAPRRRNMHLIGNKLTIANSFCWWIITSCWLIFIRWIIHNWCAETNITKIRVCSTLTERS